MEDMMLACCFHDIGAFKTEKYLELLKFDVQNPIDHCVYGYLFMKYFSPLKEKAEVILYHHLNYIDKRQGDSIYLKEAFLIHLLDRVDVCYLSGCSSEETIRRIKENSGILFAPEDVELFLKTEEKYHLLEQLENKSYQKEVEQYWDNKERRERLISDIVEMLVYEIDFRSEQTVVHTLSIVEFSKQLGEHFLLSQEDVERLRFGSLLHDLGKIKTPTHILEKAGKLTPEEMEIMKLHVVHTEEIIKDLFPKDIIEIAIRHHERLDGTGYPKQLTAEELTFLERIVMVADITSALLQKRSYRDEVPKKEVVEILEKQTQEGKLDKDIVDMLVRCYDEIWNKVKEYTSDSVRRYENLQIEYQECLRKYSRKYKAFSKEYELFSENWNRTEENK